MQSLAPVQAFGQEAPPADTVPASAREHLPETTTPMEQPVASPTSDALQEQIAEECALLLKLVTELRVETQKSNAEVLSMHVIRKARQIQELARKIQQEMKTATGKT